MQRLAVLTTVAVVAALAAPLPVAAGPAPAATCFGKKATIVGTSGKDRIVGTDGSDVIVGRGGDDVIMGRGGDDLICGNYGADRLSGGPGKDSLNGGKGRLVDIGPGDGEEAWAVKHDVFLPGPGNDYLVLGVDDRAAPLDLPDHVSYANALGEVRVDIPNRRITGEGIDRLAGAKVAVTGSPFDDLMLGGPGGDHFRGHDGPDILLGRGGDDDLFDHTSPDAVADGGPGDRDRLEGGAGDDRIEARAGRDILIGGPDNDELRSFGGSPDVVLGGPGDDSLQDDWVFGSGAVVDGGPGHDTLWPDLKFWKDGKRVYPPTTMDLRSGVTTIEAAATTTMQVLGVEAMEWNGGPLTFHGTDAAEFIGPTDIELRGRLQAYGYGGDDEFGGSARDDFIDGGDGTDAAHTHGGVDRCISVERTFDRDSCEVND